MYYDVLDTTSIPNGLHEDVNKAIDIFFEPWEYYGKDYREKVEYFSVIRRFELNSKDFLGTIEFKGIKRDTVKNVLQVEFLYYVVANKDAHKKSPYCDVSKLFIKSKVVNNVIDTKGKLQDEFGITDLYFTMFSSICEALCYIGMKFENSDDEELFSCIDRYINACLDKLNMNIPKSNPIYETNFFDALSEYTKYVNHRCYKPYDYEYRDLVLYNDSSHLMSSDEMYLEMNENKYCNIYVRIFDANKNNDFRFCLNEILSKVDEVTENTLCAIYNLLFVSLFKEKRYRHVRTKLDFHAVMDNYINKYWSAYEKTAHLIRNQNDFVEDMNTILNLSVSRTHNDFTGLFY